MQRKTSIDEIEIEPGRSVKYSLFAPHPGLDDKPENYFTMTYALEETNGATTLTITHNDAREQRPQEADQVEESQIAVLNTLKMLVEG